MKTTKTGLPIIYPRLPEEFNRSKKLTTTDRILIREMFESGVPRRTLMEQFKVSKHCIYMATISEEQKRKIYDEHNRYMKEHPLTREQQKKHERSSRGWKKKIMPKEYSLYLSRKQSLTPHGRNRIRKKRGKKCQSSK